jgi:fatty-acyl-CoA synthase
MHSHRSTMHTLVANMRWFALDSGPTLLAVAPFFHVTGMQGGMNGPLYNGNTVVLLPRWDREVAAQCVERYQVIGWTAVPTMIQDFFMNPNIGRYDLSSIRRLSGGGAAMPAAVAQRLEDIGVTYFEGYGLTETMAATHINPPQHAKKQCLGIPVYDVDSRGGRHCGARRGSRSGASRRQGLRRQLSRFAGHPGLVPVQAAAALCTRG